jgi:hypothetical protein
VVARRLQLLLLAVGAGTAAVLLHRKQVDPFYLWALRRWVPELVPVFAVFAGYALALLFGGARASRWRRAAALALCALTVGWGLLRGRHLIAHRDYAGAYEGISRVAALVPDDALAVCVSAWIATPLQYVFGKETLQGPDDTPEMRGRLEETLAAWAGRGRKVLLVTDGEYSARAVRLEPAGSVAFSVPVLERPRTRYPRAIRENRHDVRVYRVAPLPPRR